jgi:hypothetical protein
MYKVLLQLDEDSIKQDKNYNIKDIYTEIDNLYKKAGCYLLNKTNDKYIYTIDNFEEAPARLGAPSLKIRRTSWFKYMKEFWLIHESSYNNNMLIYEDMINIGEYKEVPIKDEN